MGIRDIPTGDYLYELPPERIAAYPLGNRDASRLLISDGENTQEAKFTDLPQHIPQNSLLVFNDTRVLYARLIFRKPTGAEIEVFLLEPQSPVQDIQLAFQQSSGIVWKCLVGNARRWKSGTLSMAFNIGGNDGELFAERISSSQGHSMVRFTWLPAGLAFAEVLEASGRVPLPPYIHREAEPDDKVRYQTVYARNEGSVAAPTAGLHFTDRVMHELREKGHSLDWLTLHVGAGTFKPVSSERIGGHEMHREQVLVRKEFIENLIAHQGKVIAVGTTSVRTLESLYWMGVRILEGHKDIDRLDQWEPYDLPGHREKAEALGALSGYLEKQKLQTLRASTEMIIVPGYDFRIADGMLTNFHQPGSTLLMLVAAYLGEGWRDAYDYALGHGFRFLSYGDSCLFIR